MINRSNYIKKNQYGFTLVELAVVMMIIGLLIGGVLRGQEMAENARLKNVMKQVTSYTAAVTSFQDTYGALPGDMINATQRIPNCNGTSFCAGGNGNSRLADNDPTWVTDWRNQETAQFWKHLILADLISGVTPTVNVGANGRNNLAWGESHPSSAIGGGFEVITDPIMVMGAMPTRSTNVMRLSNDGLNGRLNTAQISAGNTGVINPIRALQIDQKMDDGIGKSGFVYVNYGTDNDGCTRATEYVSSSSKTCVLFFQF